MGTFLQELTEGIGIECELHEVDIQNSPEWDLTDKGLQAKLLTQLQQGYYHVVLITPPCSTWSRVRGANCRGPPMIRPKQHPWGFPWLAKRHQKDADLGNELIRFMLKVLETLEAHPHTQDGQSVGKRMVWSWSLPPYGNCRSCVTSPARAMACTSSQWCSISAVGRLRIGSPLGCLPI